MGVPNVCKQHGRVCMGLAVVGKALVGTRRVISVVFGINGH